MSDNDVSRDHLSHRLQRILAERLNTYGMQTRESRHGEEIVEIAATNPRDPDKGGRVVIGYEGYLVWERWTDFKSDSDAIAAADVIHVLLTEDLTGRTPAAESQLSVPETPARVAVDSARAGPSRGTPRRFAGHRQLSARGARQRDGSRRPVVYN